MIETLGKKQIMNKDFYEQSLDLLTNGVLDGNKYVVMDSADLNSIYAVCKNKKSAIEYCNNTVYQMECRGKLFYKKLTPQITMILLESINKKIESYK